MKKLIFKGCLFMALLPLSTMAQLDPASIQKIRTEGLDKSQVMDIAFNLTDKSGNRLANSEGYTRAANYAKDVLTKNGAENAAITPWGEFGKGWDLEKMYFAITAPYYKPLLAWPKSWTSGTNGLKNAAVLVVDAKDSITLMAYKGQLKGKIIILDQENVYKQSFKADAARYTDEELAKMEAAAAPAIAKTPDTAQQRRMREMQAQRSGPQRVLNLLKAMAVEEGAVAMLTTATRNHDGTIFAQGGGTYKATDPANFLDMAMSVEDYNTILRLAKSGTTVKADLDVKTKFHNKDLQGYNVFAEIKGTDPLLKDEVVMIGAHLDSWQSGTGATDNASGSAVMIEAMRIIKASGIAPKRTIRIGLWSAEEEGLLGSRGYVKNTFMDANNQPNAAHQKLSTYFNIDNGTGKIRGIYAQGNTAAAEIFKTWFTPFHDLGAKTVTLNNTGSTDHISFDAVGIPGFQFIQDPIEYSTRTHHSNMDVYDHLMQDDLKQIATIVATFALNAAQHSSLMPRKEQK
jgi:carboxypeptidase Q